MISNLFSLAEKVVVITGAAGLLGRQHADAVATAGGIPVLLDLRQDPVEQLADVFRKTHGVDALGFAVDITQEEQVASNCLAILERFGRIDGLINNAANNPKVENNGEKNFSR
ncbi:MAG: SDR family NAD(P)-dependent oxidoreductase, partial [Deltaproteobacteria bacterium]